MMCVANASGSQSIAVQESNHMFMGEWHRSNLSTEEHVNLMYGRTALLQLFSTRTIFVP